MNRPDGEDPSGPERHSARTADVPAARNSRPSYHLPLLLAALCDRLPKERIAAVEQIFAATAGPDDPLLGRFIAAQAAVGLAPQLSEIVRAWSAEAPRLTGPGIALMGVVLRDPHLVEPLVDHFRWLLAPENMVMRRA